MSEATVLVKSVEQKTGEKNGKAWTRTAVTDGNDQVYSTFAPGAYDGAKYYEGKQAVIEFTENGKFKDLVSIKPAPEDPKEKLGTGEYIGAQKAPADKQAIARSVALKAAVDSFESAPLAASPKQISDKVGPLAQAYEVYLNTGKWPGQLGEDDIPF